MIYFDNASAEIRVDQITTVDTILHLIQNTLSPRIRIQAHTDQKGEPKFNEKLSKERANSIANFLITKGVEKDIIETSFFGEEQLLTDNTNPDSLQQNRRAHINIYSAKPTVWLRGKVIDSKTDSPIVSKVYMHSKFWKQAVLSDSLGNFKLLVPKGEVIGLNASSLKYLASEEMIKVNDQFVEDQKIIELIPGDGQWLKGQILNDSGSYVTDANVQMSSALWSDMTRSDSTGEFRLFIPTEGSINIDVIANDYLIGMNSIKVSPKLLQEQLDIKLQRISEGMKINLRRMFFRGSKDLLLNKSFHVLHHLLAFMEINRNTCIKIDGHINSPNRPKTEINSNLHDLSIARSRRIYKFLLSNGIHANKMIYKGYGNWNMIHPNTTLEKEMAENRRVEVVIMNCDEIASMKSDTIAQSSYFHQFRFQNYITY